MNEPTKSQKMTSGEKRLKLLGEQTRLLSGIIDQDWDSPEELSRKQQEREKIGKWFQAKLSALQNSQQMKDSVGIQSPNLVEDSGLDGGEHPDGGDRTIPKGDADTVGGSAATGPTGTRRDTGEVGGDVLDGATGSDGGTVPERGGRGNDGPGGGRTGGQPTQSEADSEGTPGNPRRNLRNHVIKPQQTSEHQC